MKFENIDDLDIAKQALVLMDKEVHRLLQKTRTLLEENALLRGEGNSKDLQQAFFALQQQSEILKKKVFGRSSERRTGDSNTSRPDKPKRPSQAKQVDLPTITATHELHKDDMGCNSCGGVLEEWDGQFEEYEEIDIIHREYRVVRNRRKKYRCKCGCSPVTAPGPLRMPGSKYSVDFSIAIVVDKWGIHLPLTRQQEQMAQLGCKLSDAQLLQVAERFARVLKSTYDALGEQIADSELIHADETPWPMLTKGHKKWWMWTFSNYDSVCIVASPSRSHETRKYFLCRLLEHSSAFLVVDGYSVYEMIARMFPDITLALCWSHARRKFIEAESSHPEASEMIDLMRELFMIERSLPGFRSISDEKARAEILANISEIRKTQSAPIVDAIFTWMQSQRTLPGGKFAEAIKYLSGNRKAFGQFLNDPRIPLTNNQAERTIRPAVVGRKNHYGSKSERGIEVAAIFYSLLGSCRMIGVDPVKYLREAARTALENPGAVLLPKEYRDSLQ